MPTVGFHKDFGAERIEHVGCAFRKWNVKGRVFGRDEWHIGRKEAATWVYYREPVYYYWCCWSRRCTL